MPGLQELQDAAAEGATQASEAAAQAQEAAAAALAEAKERVQVGCSCCWHGSLPSLACLASAVTLQRAPCGPAVEPCPRCPCCHLTQSSVAAAVAEKDAQLQAAQEALRRQLQQQLQQAEADLEVGRLPLCALRWTRLSRRPSPCPLPSV